MNRILILMFLFILLISLKAITYSAQKKFLCAKSERTGIAGLLLYSHDSQGLTSAWMGSSTGIGFGVGALLGLTAYIFGVITDRKLKAKAQLREQFGDAPSDEQMMHLQVSEQQQTTYLNICAVTLTLSLWIMEVSQYLVF